MSLRGRERGSHDGVGWGGVGEVRGLGMAASVLVLLERLPGMNAVSIPGMFSLSPTSLVCVLIHTKTPPCTLLLVELGSGHFSPWNGHSK